MWFVNICGYSSYILSIFYLLYAKKCKLTKYDIPIYNFYLFFLLLCHSFYFLLLIDKKINLNLLYTYYNLFSIFKNRVRIRTRKR